MQCNVKLSLSNKIISPQHVLSTAFGIIFLSSLSACEKPNELRAQSDPSSSSIATPKPTSQVYLTAAEKKQLKTSSDLTYLDLEARNDFLRRLSNETSLAQDSGDTELAREYAEKNLRLRQDFIEDFPKNYGGKLSVSTSLSALGGIEFNAENYTEARRYFKESLAQLKDNPPASDYKSLWLRMVGRRYAELGHLEKHLKEYQAAQENYEIHLDYVVKNPSHLDYLFDHAEAYFFLGDLYIIQAYSFQGDYSDEQAIWLKAAENYERSIRLLKKYISQANKRDELLVLRRLAFTYGQLAYTSYFQSNIDESEIASENYIKSRKLALQVPGANTSDELDLARAYYEAAKYTSGKDDEYHQAALDIFTRLEAENAIPERYDIIIERVNKALAK